MALYRAQAQMQSASPVQCTSTVQGTGIAQCKGQCAWLRLENGHPCCLKLAHGLNLFHSHAPCALHNYCPRPNWGQYYQFCKLLDSIHNNFPCATGVLSEAQLEDFLRQSALEMPALADLEVSWAWRVCCSKITSLKCEPYA